VDEESAISSKEEDKQQPYSQGCQRLSCSRACCSDSEHFFFGLLLFAIAYLPGLTLLNTHYFKIMEFPYAYGMHMVLWGAGSWTPWSLWVPSNFRYSMILWVCGIMDKLIFYLYVSCWKVVYRWAVLPLQPAFPDVSWKTGEGFTGDISCSNYRQNSQRFLDIFQVDKLSKDTNKQYA